MRQASLPASAVELVAVTTGPGGFTGIRVGIAAARGISLGIGVPLIGVTVFEAVAATARDAGREMRFLLVAIESRRADLYVQLFDRARCPLGGPAAVLPAALAEMVRCRSGRACAGRRRRCRHAGRRCARDRRGRQRVLDGEPPVLGACVRPCGDGARASNTWASNTRASSARAGRTARCGLFICAHPT